ncbi:MAG: acyl carrier protein [Cyanobacteria bacterium P01_G01_bin.67]
MEANPVQNVNTLEILKTNQGIRPGKRAENLVSVSEIQSWIVSYVAELLEVEADSINIKVPFDTYGLDSSMAIGLIGDLEDWLEQKNGYKLRLDPTLLYSYPTIETLVKQLASHQS